MRSRMRCFECLSAAALIAIGALSVAGCAGKNQINSLRNDPSINLDTLAQRHDDIDNRLVITRDTQFRQMNEDIGRVMLLDRPSRLADKPVPY